VDPILDDSVIRSHDVIDLLTPDVLMQSQSSSSSSSG